MIRRCLACDRVLPSHNKNKEFCTPRHEDIFRCRWRRDLDKWRHARDIGFPGVLAVHHIDGDPNNNDLANLRLVNARENRKR